MGRSSPDWYLRAHSRTSDSPASTPVCMSRAAPTATAAMCTRPRASDDIAAW